ncbi:major facilitator superfamily domain-containing protein [Bipolaris maydis]|nr:major facilitator superfamily domain-containing protein [Bipolaris maydis]
MSSNCTPPPSSPPSTSTCCSSSAEKRTERASLDGALTVVGSTLILYASFGLMSSFGFFQDYYSREFLESSASSSIAFVGTLQMGLTNAVGALSGALCDRFGVKYLLVGSGLGTTVALLMLSFVQPGQFWLVFMTHGFLMGLSMAFGVQPALTVVGQHFKERRGLALGVVSMGSALGGIGFPVMLGQVMPRWEFGGALRLAAAKVVVCYSIALCLCTSKPIRSSTDKDRTFRVDFGGFLDLRYAVLCAGTWFAILGLWLPAYYVKTYADNIHPGNNVSKYFLCMMNGSSMLGATLGGLLSDRVGRFNLLWPVTFLSGCLCLFLWLLSTNISTLIFFVCAYGFFSSSVNTLPTSIIGQITPDDKFGARTGAFYSVITISSLIGTPIGGALIVDEHVREGYRWLILFSGTALMVGSMFMLGSRMLHGKDSRTKRQLELS